MEVSAALVLWTIPVFLVLSAVEWIDYTRDPDKRDNAFSVRDSAGNWVSYLLIFQIPCHTERIGRLWRPYEFVFNTPSHHRVHHGSNPCYIDKNYAGVLIIWDRLFGSYAEEIEPVRYGLIHDINTDNPLKYNYFETLAMLRDLTHATTWRDRFGHAFGPPGWNQPHPANNSIAASRRAQSQIALPT